MLCVILHDKIYIKKVACAHRSLLICDPVMNNCKSLVLKCHTDSDLVIPQLTEPLAIETGEILEHTPNCEINSELRSQTLVLSPHYGLRNQVKKPKRELLVKAVPTQLISCSELG
ncbi:hypothetical protein RJT34_18028 [Clitoria ternatea]|uniref:Uncharacterized protein n=1 Tax=Clitoria ternatea TaxID=43366 RepID=A0AAN9JB96_CLITE